VGGGVGDGARLGKSDTRDGFAIILAARADGG
jgi:hypothetical protein